MASEWAAWEFDKELVAHYTIRIRAAFRAALTDASKIISAWWNGSLTLTQQGLIDAVSQLLEEHLGKVLHSLWEEAWYLGSRSADIAIRRERPDFAGWRPGQSAAERVANEAGLRKLLHATGPSVLRSIATTRMENLRHELTEAIRSRNQKALVAKLEAILQVSSRAPMIAQTETSRALSAAAMDHYHTFGVPMKRWVTAPDRVCPICLDNAAQGPIPFTSPFQSGVMSSPQHPACRCGVVPATSVMKMDNDYHSEPGATMVGARPQPPNPGGGVGMGAPSQTRRAGDGSGSEVSNAYGAQEDYQTSDTQRPGTSADSDNAGGEPPRLGVDEPEEWHPGSIRQVDENGQVHWHDTHTSNSSTIPYNRYGLGGAGAPEGPSIGTEQPQGDPFMNTQPHGAGVPTGQDAMMPGSRGRPPNAVGKYRRVELLIAEAEFAKVAPYTGNADVELRGNDYRRVIFTSRRSQMVVMTLQPGEEIGKEVHDGDQLFVFMSGTGRVVLNGKKTDVGPDSLIAVPAGTKHNVINTGTTRMRIVTVYIPPQHPAGTLEHTKTTAKAALWEPLPWLDTDTAKDATLSKEQARYRRASDWRECGNCVMREGSTCDMVKGIINKKFVCDYWMHLIHKEAPVTKGKKAPKAAGVVVKAKDTGRVLMVQRQLQDDKNASGKWEWPGGRLDDKETPITAACREWEEETGLKIPDGTVIGNWLSPDGKYEGFVLEIPHEDDLDITGRRAEDPDNGEKAALAWFDPDDLKDNPAVREQISDDIMLIRIALRGIKYLRPLITKVGPEGFIHGYICVRPPCGGPGDCDSPPCPDTPEGAAFDTHFGHVYHEGEKIGQVTAARTPGGGYRAVHNGGGFGPGRNEARQVVRTHAADRKAAAADLVYYHNIKVLAHGAIDTGNHDAVMALDNAAHSFANGDKAGANAYLKDATDAAAQAGDAGLEAHIRTFRSHMSQNEREGEMKGLKVFARKPGQRTEDIFPVKIPAEPKPVHVPTPPGELPSWKDRKKSPGDRFLAYLDAHPNQDFRVHNLMQEINWPQQMGAMQAFFDIVQDWVKEGRLQSVGNGEYHILGPKSEDVKPAQVLIAMNGVRDFLTRFNGGTHPASVAREMGIPLSAAEEAFARLLQQGEIVQQGKWYVRGPKFRPRDLSLEVVPSAEPAPPSAGALSHADRVARVNIADHLMKNPGWIDSTRLAQDLGLDQNAVDRAIDQLKDRGLIQVHELIHPGARGGRLVRYPEPHPATAPMNAAELNQFARDHELWHINPSEAGQLMGIPEGAALDALARLVAEGKAERRGVRGDIFRILPENQWPKAPPQKDSAKQIFEHLQQFPSAWWSPKALAAALSIPLGDVAGALDQLRAEGFIRGNGQQVRLLLAGEKEPPAPTPFPTPAQAIREGIALKPPATSLTEQMRNEAARLRNEKIDQAIQRYGDQLAPHQAALDAAIKNAHDRRRDAIVQAERNAIAPKRNLERAQKFKDVANQNMEYAARQLLNAQANLDSNAPSHQALLDKLQAQLNEAQQLNREADVKLAAAQDAAQQAKDAANNARAAADLAFEADQNAAHNAFERAKQNLAQQRDKLIAAAQDMARAAGVNDSNLQSDPSYRAAVAALKAGIASGEAAREMPQAHGAISQTRIVEFNDGSTAVRKQQDVRDTATEHMAMQVARILMGENAPATVEGEKPSRYEHVLWMQFVPGDIAGAYSDAWGDMSAEEKAALSTEAGRRMNFLDVITGNGDRHNQNWMIANGQPYAIDMNYAFHYKIQDPTPQQARSEWQRYNWYKVQEFHGGVPLFSKALYTEWEMKLAQLETEFQVRKMDNEFRQMMKRFNYWKDLAQQMGWTGVG